MARVQKGFWIRNSYLDDPDEYVCSVCGEVFDAPWAECPECGSQMVRIKDGHHYSDDIMEYETLFGEDG